MKLPVLRPPGVPPEAEWRFEADEWVVAPRNAEGEYHGEVRSFRADGTPGVAYQFVEGRRHGPFRTYHPSGALLREGRYANDKLDGWVVVRTDGEEQLGALQECCVPVGARTLRQEYDAGALVAEAFYDRDGRQLMPDGALCPDRPPNVDERAIFDVASREWIASARAAGGFREGVARRFTQSGLLLEEVTWHADGRCGASRRFSATGELLEQGEWSLGRRHGAHLSRCGDPASGFFFVRGTFERDHPVGCWSLETSAGALLGARELGRARSEEQYGESDAFEDHARDAEHFRLLALALRAEGRMAEALAASARHAAKIGDPRRLLEEVEATPLPRQAWLEISSENGAISSSMTAWLLGAETRLVLERLARWFGATHRAGLDFASAALLLAPDDASLRLRRAEACFELGDPLGMSGELAHLRADEPEIAMLRQCGQILYGGFEFAPFRESYVDSVPEGLPEFAEVDTSRIALMMQKAATRLECVRRALLEACARSGIDAPAFLPPESGLGDAAPPLERTSFTLEEDGASVTITVDETLDLSGLGVPALLAQAHLDWTALCLLAWAAGLDELALPLELRPRDDFQRALATSLERCRVFDECRRSPARRKDHPEQRFRGIPVPELTASALSFAAAYYREIRAVLFYLTDPECRSLWQDDLRPA